MHKLTKEEILQLKEYVEDAMFWIDLEKNPQSNDGFKFLAATYGLQRAHEEAKDQKLKGKEKEKFVRPHQDLYTMFNPYSGNGESKKN